MRPLTIALGLLVALGIFLRLWLLVRSRGTNDIVLWELFAKDVAEHGLRHCYETHRLFNHPPLMGLWAALAFSLSKLTSIRFEVLFKLAPLAAEVATGVLLYRLWQARNGQGLLALAAFALGLVSLLVGSYHGNTDLMVAYFCLLAACLFDAQKPLGAGLALAAAINVKLLPVLLIPIYVLQCRRKRDFGRLLIGLCVGAIPFIPLFLITPRTFYNNVFAYQAPVPMRWGLYALLFFAKDVRNMPEAVRGLIVHFWASGRYLVVGAGLAIATLGRFRREYSVVELSAAAIAAFLVLTPGFGVQYTAWCVPLFFALSLGRALVYSSVAGLFILLFYLEFWTRTARIETHAAGPISTEGMLVGMITWTLLVTWVVRILRSRALRR